MTPTREVYFNITHVWVMYAILAAALAIFAKGWYDLWRLWRLGQPAARTQPMGARLARALKQVFSQETLLRRYRTAGVFHALFFWGFIVLFLATTVVFIHEDLRIHIMQGWFYLVFQSLIVDLFGAFAIVGILMAFAHRYLYKAKRLKPDTREDALILAVILLILVQGYVLEGLRIELTRDSWAAWSPVGRAAGALLASWMSVEAMRGLHRFTWWFHAVTVFGFLAWIPYSKLRHLFTSPANIYLQDLGPKGALPPLDLEKAEMLGVSRLKHFTWKDLFDLDSCTECGRCEVNCPAFLTSKPLSPKALILDLRNYMHKQGAARSARANGAAKKAFPNGEPASPLVGRVIHEDTLWSCTTCRACMEQCPVMIEQVPKIVEMRRHLVMERAEFPDDLQAMVRSLEARAHPYPGAQASRTDWMQGLRLTDLAEKPDAEFEVLFWVGCAGALNKRNQEVTRSLAQVLTRAGVKFAVLGREERCTGDPARRIGYEFLFQQLARQNIQTLDRFKVKTVVATCPHCFHCLKNEYPQLGGNYEVLHHSEFLEKLVAESRLKPAAQGGWVTYHDPCYLGRYNGVYDAPRRLLASATGASGAEPEWNRANALCCGGGGGFSFMEEKTGTRINQNRAKQLLATGAETVGVACPFCMVMLEDGVKNVAGDRNVQVLDVAEVLERATRP